eukprot:1147694-Pelagomonas_calceolata.AAC.7
MPGVGLKAFGETLASLQVREPLLNARSLLARIDVPFLPFPQLMWGVPSLPTLLSFPSLMHSIEPPDSPQFRGSCSSREHMSSDCKHGPFFLVSHAYRRATRQLAAQGQLLQQGEHAFRPTQNQEVARLEHRPTAAF